MNIHVSKTYKYIIESIIMGGGDVWIKAIREIHHYLLYLKVTSSDNKESSNRCLKRGKTHVFIYIYSG